MSNPSTVDHGQGTGPGSEINQEPTESFGDVLSQFERSHSHKPGEGKGLQGTVVAISNDSVFLDIGYKTEGTIPLADFQATGDTVKRGDKLPVTIKGRDPEGYYELSRIKVERPKDWSSLEKAFAERTAILGVVSGAIK